MDSWLAGGKLGGDQAAPSASVGNGYRGEGLGVPEQGVGAVSSMARRLGALVIDCVLASVLTSFFVHPHLTDAAGMQALNYWAVGVWFVFTVLGTSIWGVTPGMAALGIRVVRIDNTPMVGVLRAVPRAVLVAIVIPAAVWNSDNRGLHDRLLGTAVLRTRA
jgi:uncharacterized RDD family membrane protein YckC